MLEADFEVEAASYLDLFSTSASVALVLSPKYFRCDFHAPFFAYQKGGKRYAVVQGCCNHWECRRCGVLVAKAHYGRIVEGARQIAADEKLYFITVTCRGLELSAEEAKAKYLAWTHRLLRTCQQKHTRAGGRWFYAQVTELQKRGHPHSHILTTFRPPDLVDGAKENWSTINGHAPNLEYVSALRSDWFQEMVQKAGLGEQYDISEVQSVEAASRYVAKYMFKDSQFGTHFPKGWKRVRYSQNWPKLERKKSDAFVLLSTDDWRHLASLAAVVDAECGDTFEIASHHLANTDILVNEVNPQAANLTLTPLNNTMCASSRT